MSRKIKQFQHSSHGTLLLTDDGHLWLYADGYLQRYKHLEEMLVSWNIEQEDLQGSRQKVKID